MNETKLPEITKEQYKEAAGIVETIAGQKYQPDVLVMDWYCKQLERKVAHQRAAMEAMAVPEKVKQAVRDICIDAPAQNVRVNNALIVIQAWLNNVADTLAYFEAQVKGERT